MAGAGVEVKVRWVHMQGRGNKTGVGVGVGRTHCSWAGAVIVGAVAGNNGWDHQGLAGADWGREVAVDAPWCICV